MKKTYIWAIIIVLLIVIVISYKGHNSSNSVKIGVAIPLTGNYASIGEKIKHGLDFAKQDIESKNPGVTVDLVYEDACLPKDITSALQKLITIDKIHVVNQFCAIGLVPSLDITEPAKVISVGVAANVSDLMGKSYYFSPNFAVKGNAVTIADFAINTLHAKKVAFIYYNTQFGKDYRKSIGDRIVESGGQIVGDEMTDLAVTDFKTNLTKIKSANPDVIFITQLTGALATILKQSKDLGITVPLVGNYQNEDATVLSTAGKSAEGFIISSADPLILSHDTSGFKEAFQAKYNLIPDVFASNAYDALHLEVSAYLKCNDNTDCIRSELHKVSDYQGVSGTITIDSNGFASKPTVFKIVKDGQFVLYK